MNTMKIGCAFILLILVSALSVFAAGYEGWRSYTSTSEVRYMKYIDDTLHVMTSGGWLKIDPATQELTKITNTEGTGVNDLHYILKDNAGVKWIAGYGRLVKCLNGSYMPFMFLDRDDNPITLYTVSDDEDLLWIGASSGLALFSKTNDGGQIEDFYFRFGDLSADVPVYDILLMGDTIWLATADGVAYADKSNPDLLKSFANWRTIRPSLLSGSIFDSVFAIDYYKDNFYIGTKGDVFRLEMTPSDTSLVDIPTRNNITVKHMYVHGDSLIIYAGGGFFTYDGVVTTWSWTPTMPFTFAAGQIIDDIHWLGNYLTGVYYGTDTIYQQYEDGGLPGNNVTDLVADDDGRVAGSFMKDGVALFDSDGWHTVSSEVTSDGMRVVLFDIWGDIWSGSWGGGLHYIGEDTVIYYNEDNSTLHGVPGSPYYVVVNALAMSSKYIFMVNILPSDQKTVHWVDMYDHSGWGSFGFDDSLPGVSVSDITVNNDVFAVGTPDDGVYLYYYGPDPDDKTDDSVLHLTEENSWLGSNEVRKVQYDNSGVLWVGTKFGLSRYDYGIDRFVNVSLPVGFGPDVNELAFDRRGNIWIGSGNGLARYDAGTGSISVFTSANSGLVDDNITGLTINPKTGDLWVGTPLGISRLASEIGPATANIEHVIAFPNPLIISDDNDVLNFNYAGNAVVRIFTVSGELVWENNINIAWKGKNQSGSEVAPGVYLFLLTADDGSTGSGKILLIRE